MYALDGRYIQDHFPGIGRYTFNLADALPRVAPEDEFLVLHNPALRNTHYDVAGLANYPNVRLAQVDVPTFSPREQWRLLPGGSQPVLLHSPYYIKPYILRIPSVVTIFDLLPLYHPAALPSARTRILFRVAMEFAARTATHVITSSASTADDVHTRLRVPRSRVSTIPLAADARFAPAPANELERVREGYGLTTEYVLCVGINKPHKNLETLIAAWGLRTDRTRTLVIAGAWDPRYANVEAAAQAAMARGAGAIRFLRNVTDADLPALYSGAAAFVMPSLYEGFGLPVLEAMACGTPVIVSNVSSLPEVAGEAGLYFDPRDAQGLARCLATLLDDRRARADWGARAQARAARFSWEQAARATMAVYRAVRG
jgi:glycosyltransferase involved in cell wall biosynthesis